MKYPFTPYKIDQKFANPTDYGPHEGLDINGPGGGNTDCGTLLYPLRRCEIVHTSKSTKGYGNLIVYAIYGTWGERFVRYAHCQEFLQTHSWADETTPIAKMGSTGNSTACHLHFDILKKIPDNWRIYAKNQSELNEWFEDPQTFIEKWKDEGTPQPETPAVVITDQTRIPQIENKEVQAIRSEYYDRYNLIDSQKKQIIGLQTEIAGLKQELDIFKAQKTRVEVVETGTSSSNQSETVLLNKIGPFTQLGMAIDAKLGLNGKGN